MIENDGTNMAAELSGDPKGPRFNAKSAFAYRGLVSVIPIRSWGICCPHCFHRLALSSLYKPAPNQKISSQIAV